MGLPLSYFIREERFIFEALDVLTQDQVGAMSTPTKQDALTQNSYEIPSCTICLQELVEDLSSLGCGHIFHLGCISQHFQYRGTCPNCQKRSSLKELRVIHFQFTPKTQATAQLQSILSTLSDSEKKELEVLLKELKKTTEANERLKSQIGSHVKDLVAVNKLVESLRQELHQKRRELQRLRGENVRLDKDCKQFSEQLDFHLKTQMKLRVQLEKLRSEEKEFEQVKRYKKLMAENSQEIVKYREELEANGAPPQEMFKIFYDMLLMKSLEGLRAKEKLKEYPQKLSDRDFEISRQKNSIEAMRKEMKQANEKRLQERKKYDELKEKYLSLSEKARLKGLKEHDIPQMDDNSQSFGSLSKSFHVPEDPVIQSMFKKPFFAQGGASAYGGFVTKKKMI